MNYCKQLLLLLLLLVTLGAQAQNSGEQIVEELDTVTSTQVPDQESVIQERTIDNNFSEEADTVLKANNNHLDIDTIASLRRSSNYNYINSFDSLLRAEYAKAAKEKAASKLPKDEPSDNIPPPSSGGSSWFADFLASGVGKAIFLMLGIGFVGVIVYRLFLAQGVFQRAPAKSSNQPQTDTGNSDAPELSNLTKALSEAESKQEYRLAIRLLYLQALKKLATKKAIVFAPDKTNSQYVRELNGSPVLPAFKNITLQYECIWYGQFDISVADYKEVRAQFQSFNQSL